MKTLIAIVLFIALILPFGSHYGWISWQKKVVRKEVKRKLMGEIDKSELIYFSFSKETVQNELRWKHAHEFEYKGEMYDIVEKKETPDSAFYWVWWDHEETHLNKQLKELISNALDQNNQNKKGQQICISLLKTHYLIPVFDLPIPFSLTTPPEFPSFQSPHFYNLQSAPSTPPPQG